MTARRVGEAVTKKKMIQLLQDNVYAKSIDTKTVTFKREESTKTSRGRL